MRARQTVKSLTILSILLLGLLTATNLAAHIFGALPGIRSVSAQAATTLGVDCGLGSTIAVADPVTGIPGGDGTLDTSCSWIGDVDGDTVLDPLVSDNVAFTPQPGGGFSAEIRVLGLTGMINGFDIQLSYNTKYLDAVKIDQSGLVFGGQEPTQTCFSSSPPSCSVFTLSSSIDHSAGLVRVAQVLLGTSTGPGTPDNFAAETFFRVRFDVVGVGQSALDIHDDFIVLASTQIEHTTQDGAFESKSFFDASGTLNPDISWTFSPNPEVPGNDLTLTAAATCPGCGALSYSWDTNSDGTSDASGSSPTITPPTGTLIVHRVVLTVTDGTHSFTAVRRLPLTVNVQGPSTVAVNTSQTWNGLWLGGIPPYTGSWRFCPGAGVTANAVCAKPAPPVASTTGQTNSQLLNAPTSPVGAYHFAGVYTDALKITDSVSSQISTTANSITFTFSVTVTGTPAAFTVTVSNPAKGTVGTPVTVTATTAYASTYPTAFRSNSFDFTFDFGDGSSPTTISKTGCSTAEPPASPCTLSTDHIFVAKGSPTITVKAQETGSAAVSKIAETGTAPITINPLPVTATFIFSPANPDTTTDVTFTATPSGGTSPYTFDWNFGDGTAHGTTNPVIHRYATGGTKTVTLTVTDANHVSSSPVSHNVPVTGPAKTPLCTTTCTFLFDPTSPTVGKPVTFTATAHDGTPPYHFSWNFGDGTPADTNNPATHTFAAPNPTYNVVVTITDSATPVQSQTVSHSVSVVAQPTILGVTVSCGTATAGKPVTCNADATGGTSPYTFVWRVDGTVQAGVTVSSFTKTFPVKGSHTVNATVTDNATPHAMASDQKTVTVTAQTLHVSLSCPSATVGKPLACTATATGGTPSYTYQWSVDGTIDTTQTGANFDTTFPAKGSHQIIVKVTDMNSMSAQDTANVTVNGQPLTADFTVDNSNPGIGVTVNFSATASGGTSGYSFSWNFGDGSAGEGSSTSHSYSVKGAQTVTLTVTDANSDRKTAMHTVQVKGTPLSVDFTFDPSSPTTGKPVTFTATASGGTPSYRFSWTFGDGSSGTGATTQHSFPTKGMFTVMVTVTDANGATAPASHTLTVTGQPLAITGITVSPTMPTQGKTTTFNATITGGTGPYTVSWDFGDSSPPGSGFPTTHVYANPGPYTVTATVMDANGGTTTPFTMNINVVAQVSELTVDFLPVHSVVGNTDFVGLITGGAPPYGCSWNFGDGSPAQTGCNVTHNYLVAGTFSVTLSVTDSGSGSGFKTQNVLIDPGPALIRGKVHWTHHLSGTGATERFIAKVFNPSSFTIQVTLTVNIFDDMGHFVATVTNTESIQPGAVDLGFTASWAPTNTGRFSFTASLSYSMDLGDLNGDETHEMLTGTDGSKSGTFAVVP